MFLHGSRSKESTDPCDILPPRPWDPRGPTLPLLDQVSGTPSPYPSRHMVPSFSFFPAAAYWPVWPGQSTVSVGRKLYRSPFNWGEAHCAGEKVKRKIGPFLRKSLKNQTKTRTQQKGAQPATATRNPLARLPGARAKEEKTTTNKRLHKQILVRLNVLDLQWTIL